MYATRHGTWGLLLDALFPWTGVAAKSVEVVVVSAARQNYRALSATGATKTDTLLKDLPQSVRILSADLLRDAGVIDLAGARAVGGGMATAGGGVNYVGGRKGDFAVPSNFKLPAYAALLRKFVQPAVGIVGRGAHCEAESAL